MCLPRSLSVILILRQTPNYRLSVSPSIRMMKSIDHFLRIPGDFFYFVPAPHPSVHLASEVRFRITRDHDPSSFQGGSDLLLPNMTPWRIPLVVLARRSRYSGLRHLLLQDGLTTTLSLSHCAALGYSIGPKSHVIHSLGQLFALNFHENRCTVHLASADSLHKFQYHFFGEQRGRGVSRVRPYAGKPGNEFTSLAES